MSSIFDIDIDDSNSSADVSIGENINKFITLNDGTLNFNSQDGYLYYTLHKNMSQACSDDKNFDIISPLTFLIDSFYVENRMNFLIEFGKTVKDGIIILTNQKSQMDNSDPNVRIYTYYDFILQIYNADFTEFKELFESSDDTESQKLYKLLKNVREFINIQLNSKVIVLDEYPKISAWFLLQIYMICKKYKLFLIFIGDKYELKNFSTPGHHSNQQNSYSLIKILSDLSFQLPREVTDDTFSSDFEDFIKLLAEKGTEDNVKLTFDLLYFLFEKFKLKFYKRDSDFNSETMFMSHHHKCLKSHLLKYEEYLERSKVREYIKSYYCYSENNKYHSINLESDKFLPYLILVKGDKYIYTDCSGYNKKIVTLSDINLLENTVTIQDGNETFILERRMMSYELPQKLVDSLKNNLPENITDTDIYQFPLKPYNVSTYYAAQCLTVPIENVELNLDNTPANSVYVALSRINWDTQISKIHSSNLTNLMVTKYFEIVNSENLYYYKIPNADKIMEQRLLENLQLPHPLKIEELNNYIFTEVHDIIEFENNSEMYINIKRTKYAEIEAKHLRDTPLISITKFMIEHFDDITNNMLLNFEDLDAMYNKWKNNFNTFF